MMIDGNLSTPPLFLQVRKGDGPVNQYGIAGASEHVLDALIKLWGVSQYQCAGLLGQTYRSNFSRYMNGERRPSALMCLRLLELGLLFQQGLELHRIRIIDWEPDPIVIYWNNGNMSSPDQATGRWPELPTPDNGIRSPHGATRLALQSQSAEPNERRKRYVSRGRLK